MGMTAPLMSAAASEARKSNRRAMDSGWTHLVKSAAGLAARLAGVSITLGKTMLAVTPELRTSAAMVRMRAISAALETP